MAVLVSNNNLICRDSSYNLIVIRIICTDTGIYDSKLNLLRSISTDINHIYAGDQENVGQMCIETIVEGSAVIVFCPSKGIYYYYINRMNTIISYYIYLWLKQTVVHVTYKF